MAARRRMTVLDNHGKCLTALHAAIEQRDALRVALEKALAHADAAMHQDQQYADDRPGLLKIVEDCR